jgi:type I restriction enzyme, S subunit
VTYRSQPLGKIATIEREGIDPRSIRSGARYVGLENIDSTGAVQDVSVENGDLASTKFSFMSDHILFGKLRPYLRKIARPNFDGICSTDIIPIKPSEKIDRDYLFHFLRLDEVVDKAASLATGINLPRLSPRILETFDVPVPPLGEQRRIAAILDQADDLRRKRQESIERMPILIGEIFAGMFGDSPACSGKWPTDKLGTLAAFENGDRSRNYPSGDEILESGVPFLSTKNIVDDRLDLSALNFIAPHKFASLSRGKARPEDLIITLRGTLGSCCIFDNTWPTAFINAQMMIIRAGPMLLPSYLHAFMTLPSVKTHLWRIGNGAAVPQLTAAQLSELAVPVPPLQLQRDFADRLRDIEKLKVQQSAHLAKLDALFASLQHRAFRGAL